MDLRDTLLQGHQEDGHLDHTVTQDIKSKMNLLLPISKLPPEILSIIFSFVKAGHSYYTYGCRQAKGIWIREVTHICRHWRNIALDVPTLWDDPPKSMRKQTAFLARSKSTALYIEWPGVSLSDGPTKFLKQLLEHASRIRSLRLPNGEHTNEDILLQLSSRQLESLEVLQLGFSIVPTALLMETKALRELYLDDCIVKWKSFACNDLKILSICNFQTFDVISPTVSRLLDIIGNMPSLTSLTLGHGFVSGDEVLLHPRVHLSSLEILVVKACLEEAIDLFQSIAFPATARVNITALLYTHANKMDEINTLFAAIKDSLSLVSEEAAYLTFSYAERGYSDGIEANVGMSLFKEAIDIYSSDGINLVDYAQPNFSISLNWEDKDMLWSTDPTDLSIPLAAFMDSGITKMDSVKYVFLESNLENTYSNSARLASTIGRLSSVSDILATGGMMRTLSKALRRKLNHSQYFFPNLAVVSLLGNEPFASPRKSMKDDYNFNFNNLIKSLERRKKDNVGVQKVGFDEASHQSIADDDLRKLLQSVGSVQIVDLWQEEGNKLNTTF